MNELKKLKFIYKETPRYRHISATGVVGGPITTGDLLCNFFLEHRSLPDEISISFESNVKPIETPLYSQGKDTYIRELQVGIIMNPKVAKSIGE
jgi:hypothetical protein